jgi:tellurium resistance protein TerD
MTETLNLTKGERVDLTKTNPGLTIACIGLGWDVNPNAGGGTYDLDAFAFVLKDGKLIGQSKESVVFFGNKTSKGIEHGGDNLTGVGDGDDETITLNLPQLDPAATEVIIGVNIYQGEQKHQNFGMVNNAFIRIYDGSSKAEIMKYDLTEDNSKFTAMIMGKLYKKDGEWKFQAIGEGKNGDINVLANAYA